jgi:uncharacterized protein (TIGR02284 family)
MPAADACTDGPGWSGTLIDEGAVMMDDREVIGVLNGLIETCKDGEYGFAKCAERVNTASLKEVLTKRSVACRSAARELQSLVVQHGGEPAERGSVLAALHRGWVSMVDVLSANADHSVLAECERGEDSALARYRHALATDGLPLAVREVIERQCAGVQVNHDLIRKLRDSVIT